VPQCQFVLTKCAGAKPRIAARMYELADAPAQSRAGTFCE